MPTKNKKSKLCNYFLFYFFEFLSFSFPLFLLRFTQKLKENSSLENPSRENWLNYYLQLTKEIGFCWNDTDKLKILDDDGLKEKIRYYLTGTTLKKGVIKPTGSPPVYLSANESCLAHLVHPFWP